MATKKRVPKKEGKLLALIGIVLALVGFVGPYRWHEMPPTLTSLILTIALVILLWAFWDVLPASWKSPASKRAAVVGLGVVAFVAIGTWIWWPSKRAPSVASGPSAGPAFFEAGGDIHMEGDWWELPTGWVGTLARAAGSIWDKDSHVFVGKSPFPSANGDDSFLTTDQLREEAYQLGKTMNDWEYDNRPKDAAAEDAYYKAHFADRALSLTTEMLRRLGKKDLHIPHDWKYQQAESGRMVISSKTAMGPYPLNAADAYLLFLVYQLGPRGQLKIPP